MFTIWFFVRRLRTKQSKHLIYFMDSTAASHVLNDKHFLFKYRLCLHILSKLETSSWPTIAVTFYSYMSSEKFTFNLSQHQCNTFQRFFIRFVSLLQPVKQYLFSRHSISAFTQTPSYTSRLQKPLTQRYKLLSLLRYPNPQPTKNALSSWLYSTQYWPAPAMLHFLFFDFTAILWPVRHLVVIFSYFIPSQDLSTKSRLCNYFNFPSVLILTVHLFLSDLWIYVLFSIPLTIFRRFILFLRISSIQNVFYWTLKTTLVWTLDRNMILLDTLDYFRTEYCSLNFALSRTDVNVFWGLYWYEHLTGTLYCSTGTALKNIQDSKRVKGFYHEINQKKLRHKELTFLKSLKCHLHP